MLYIDVDSEETGKRMYADLLRIAITRLAPYQPMPMNLETERLTMRPWAETDTDDYCALFAERDDGVLTVETARESIANHLATSAKTGIALLHIRRRIGGDFIGYCGLVIGRATVEEPEIAYELLRRAHGHGYATEAACAVLDAAIATGRKQLWSTVRVWNAPSFAYWRSWASNVTTLHRTMARGNWSG